MPSVSYDILDCVIYLYPSEDEAEQGVEAGGTGFIVSMPPSNEDDNKLDEYDHLYAISNQHVVGENVECPSPVIRLNTHDGKHDVYPLGCEQWIPHIDGADLSVHYFGLLKRGSFNYHSIRPEMFIKEYEVQSGRILPGNDVLMVGRFFLHEGMQRNTPSVRFGNISMMPWEPVKHPSLGDQKSFIVEMRTISGYSGSPVFIYDPYPQEEEVEAIQRGTYRLRLRRRHQHRTTLWNIRLLGIDWGHIPFQEDVLRRVIKNGQVEYDRTDLIAPTHSGQSGVVPAWILYDFLHSKNLERLRKDAENQTRQ